MQKTFDTANIHFYVICNFFREIQNQIARSAPERTPTVPAHIQGIYHQFTVQFITIFRIYSSYFHMILSGIFVHVKFDSMSRFRSSCQLLCKFQLRIPGNFTWYLWYHMIFNKRPWYLLLVLDGCAKQGFSYFWCGTVDHNGKLTRADYTNFRINIQPMQCIN